VRATPVREKPMTPPARKAVLKEFPFVLNGCTLVVGAVQSEVHLNQKSTS